MSRDGSCFQTKSRAARLEKKGSVALVIELRRICDCRCVLEAYLLWACTLRGICPFFRGTPFVGVAVGFSKSTDEILTAHGSPSASAWCIMLWPSRANGIGILPLATILRASWGWKLCALARQTFFCKSVYVYVFLNARTNKHAQGPNNRDSDPVHRPNSYFGVPTLAKGKH